MMRAMGETGRRDAALLGSDLILGSRLRAALARAGIALHQAPGSEGLPASPLVFVDLNSDVDARIEAISRITAGSPERIVVGFCDHDADGVRRRAMAAGATRVVANRHLAEAAARLAGDRA